MCYKATNTETKVKEGHVDDVRPILDAYDVRGIKVELLEKDGGWFLSWSEEFSERDYNGTDLEDEEEDDEDVDDVTGYRPSWSDSPEATRRAEVPSQDQNPDGHKGFRDFLGELAAHIETPMTILVLMVISEDRLEWSAEVHAVQPGQTQVQTISL